MATHDLTSDDTFGILHRNPSLTAFHINNERHHQNHQPHQQGNGDRRKRTPCLGVNFVVQVGDAARKADDDSGKDQKRHPIADAALSNLFTQPHDEGAARSEREHSHQNKTGAWIDHEIPSLLQTEGNAERLNRAHDNRQITGPLSDFLSSQFAFLLQLGERLIHHGQQLQNDGRRDIRHDAQGKNRQTAELSAGEQIYESQEGAPVLLKELLQLVGINPGRWDVSAQAIHGQQTKRKQNALAQVGNAKDVGQFVEHLLQHLEFAAGLTNLLLRRFGKFVRVNSESCGKLPVTKHFNGMLRPNYAGLAQNFRSNCRLAQRCQLFQIHDAIFLPENVGEAAFGHAAVQRHLAAFKTTHHPRTAARTLTFVTTRGSLAHA